MQYPRGLQEIDVDLNRGAVIVAADSQTGLWSLTLLFRSIVPRLLWG